MLQLSAMNPRRRALGLLTPIKRPECTRSGGLASIQRQRIDEGLFRPLKLSLNEYPTEVTVGSWVERIKGHTFF